jgi:hypothetical protein
MREINRLSKVKPCVRVHPVKKLSVARYLPLSNPVIGSRLRLNRQPVRNNGGGCGGARG